MYQGRDEIAAFYRRHLANVVPTFHIHRAVEDGASCWIELANGPEDAPILLASNHFTVDGEGLITRTGGLPPAPVLSLTVRAYRAAPAVTEWSPRRSSGSGCRRTACRR